MLSVAPDVQMISRGEAPIRLATWLAACLMAASARSPYS